MVITHHFQDFQLDLKFDPSAAQLVSFILALHTTRWYSAKQDFSNFSESSAFSRICYRRCRGIWNKLGGRICRPDHKDLPTGLDIFSSESRPLPGVLPKWKKAGAELGQAQLNLGSDYFDCMYIWFGRIPFIGLIEKIWFGLFGSLHFKHLTRLKSKVFSLEIRILLNGQMSPGQMLPGQMSWWQL